MKNEITEKNKNITLLANRRFLKREYDPNDVCSPPRPIDFITNRHNNSYNQNPYNQNPQQNYNRSINYNFNKITNQINY